MAETADVDQDLGSAARLVRAPADSWKATCERVVPPRRSASETVPYLGIPQTLEATAALFPRYDLDEFTQCVTAEMRRRPVPHLFRNEEVRKLVELFTKWLPAIAATVKAQLRTGVQSYNRTSRLGYPYFTIPPNKVEVLKPHFEKFIEGDLSGFEEAYITYNVRLQPESRDKSRGYQFVSGDGELYAAEIGAQARSYNYYSKKYDLRIPVFTARTRLVFNLPILNLYKQILDTAWHKVHLQHAAWKHDMFTKAKMPRPRGFVMAFDVKHFERHTAECCRLRARAIGGQYAVISAMIESMPFLCPADTWSDYFFLYPNRQAGWSEQYASGDSAVAPAQKDIFWALYAEFATRELRVPEAHALSWVAGGGDERLTIANYGDDNLIWGDRGAVTACFEFMQRYLTVEIEQPTKFLGVELVGANSLSGDPEWRLSPRNYLLKTYLNERRPGSAFRPFPSFGWVCKRRAYVTYGDRAEMFRLFELEDQVLESLGLPWDKIEARAAVEAREALAAGQANPLITLEKQYALSEETKISSGAYEPLDQETTRRALSALLTLN